MSPVLRLAWSVLAVLGFVSLALALGGDHPEGDLPAQKHWPDGMLDLVNRKERVHGYFINAQDVFQYAGKINALNDFLSQYGTLKDSSLEVVIHVGAQQAGSPWDKEHRPIQVDWTLTTVPRTWLSDKDPRRAGPGPATVSQVDLWLGDAIQLDQLAVPANVAVKSAGQIEKFIADHQKKQPPAKPKE